MNCPHCMVPLEARKLSGALDYLCYGCDGHAVTLGALRKQAEKSAVSGLWRMAAGRQSSGPGCPSCSSAMTVVDLTPDDLRALGAPDTDSTELLTLDVCRGCYLVWFDWNELLRFAGAPPPPPTAAEVEADQMLGAMKAQAEAENYNQRRRVERTVDRLDTGGSGLIDILLSFIF